MQERMHDVCTEREKEREVEKETYKGAILSDKYHFPIYNQ